MPPHVTLAGPVELIDGECALRIPLAAGGAHFVECLRGIGRVQDEHLLVARPAAQTVMEHRLGIVGHEWSLEFGRS